MISGIDARTGFSNNHRLNLSQRTGGFTLVELMIVLVLVGVLAGISLPQLKGAFLDYQLESSAGMLKAVMDFTRQRAVVEGRVFQFVIDPENRTYGLVDTENGRVVRTYMLTGDLSVQTDSDTIAYFPDGSSDQAVLELSARNGRQAVLITRGISGETTLAKK